MFSKSIDPVNPLFITSVLVLIWCGCRINNQSHAQTINKELSIRIDHANYNEDYNQLEIELTVENNSDSTYILFAFYMPNEGIDSNLYYSNPNITSGSSVIILDEGDSLANFQIPKSNVTDFDEIKSSMAKTSISYVSKKLVIATHSIKSVRFTVTPKYYIDLQANMKLCFIYYSGWSTYNFVPKSSIDSLSRKLEATWFRGTVYSDTVRVDVK